MMSRETTQRKGERQKMQIRKRHSESGSAEVEVIFILPIAILSVVMLLYLSLFLFQRANLQACLESSLVYYKNTVTDTYVGKKAVSYSDSSNDNMGMGATYSAVVPKNPYRGMFGDGGGLNSQEDFEAYFRSVAGKMLFEQGLMLTIDYSNYVVLKQFEVTALQEVSFPIDLSMLGIGREHKVSATARVAVVDHDSIVRDVDYAIDILEDTKLGEMAKEFASKISAAYAKLKQFLE